MAARYTVTGRYTASRDGVRLGPWRAGDEVELEDAVAEWVQRDSPGILQAATPRQPDPEPERAAVPVRDRQHRGGRNRGKP